MQTYRLHQEVKPALSSATQLVLDHRCRRGTCLHPHTLHRSEERRGEQSRNGAEEAPSPQCRREDSASAFPRSLPAQRGAGGGLLTQV